MAPHRRLFIVPGTSLVACCWKCLLRLADLACTQQEVLSVATYDPDHLSLHGSLLPTFMVRRRNSIPRAALVHTLVLKLRF